MNIGLQLNDVARSKYIVEEVPMFHASLTMCPPEEVGGWPILTKISLISAPQQALLAFKKDPTFQNKTQSLFHL